MSDPTSSLSTVPDMQPTESALNAGAADGGKQPGTKAPAMSTPVKSANILRLQLSARDRKLPLDQQLKKLMNFAEMQGLRNAKVLTVRSINKPGESGMKKENNKVPRSTNRVLKSDCIGVQNEKLLALKLEHPVLNCNKNLQRWLSTLLSCQDCNKNLVGPYEYVKHQREVHRWIVQACKPCQTFLSSAEDVNVHLSAAHANEENPAMIVSEDYLAKHAGQGEALSESSDSQFECLVCEDNFSTLTDLECHQGVVDHKPVECKDCKVFLACQSELNVHLKNHKHYVCKFCSENFYSKEIMIKHEYEHVETKKLKCKTCFKLFSTYAHFRSHAHTTEILCEKCGFNTYSGECMKRHMRKHMSNTIPCLICPKKFRTVFKMNLHYRRVHLKEKKFQCDICSRAFFNKFLLETHMTLHTKEFKHKCKICNARFTRLDNLNVHLKNNHRYCCPICRLIFTTAKAVIDHRSTHSIEETQQAERDGLELYEKFTNFQCDVCFKFLASKQSLGFHLLNHQGVPHPRRTTTKQGKGEKNTSGEVKNKKAKKVNLIEEKGRVEINKNETKLQNQPLRKSKRIKIRDEKKCIDSQK